jgi:hypothetical protein
MLVLALFLINCLLTYIVASAVTPCRKRVAVTLHLKAKGNESKNVFPMQQYDFIINNLV